MPRLDYHAHRERMASRSRSASRSGRELPPIPPPADLDRRMAGAASLERFAKLYFPGVFGLPWSRDHPRVIARIEAAAIHGGTFAVAMPRGSGKTTLCEVACLWAILNALRRFVVLVGSDLDAAVKLLETLKDALTDNDLLAADYPEACVPARALDGVAQRASGQLVGGKPTRLRWERTEIALARVPGAACSGAVVRARGLLGRIRGAKANVAGRSIRPDLVVIDDPQTDASAESPTQVSKRLAVVTKAILGLAGPGKRIAGVMPCTVIRPGDLADQVLDPDLHPAWRGERCRGLYRWPDAVELWDQYATLRREGQRRRDDGAAATAFYAANRAAMDAGAEVAWPERHEPGQLSGLQWIMDLKIDRGEEYVAAEINNDPRVTRRSDVLQVDAKAVVHRLSRVPAGTVPVGCDLLTAMLDVSRAAIWWAVVGWARGTFGGRLVDYGTWPPQRVRWYTLETLADTIQGAFPGANDETAVGEALEATADMVLGREWLREDGVPLRVSRCLVDANWGAMTDTVYAWARRSKSAGMLLPSHGKAIGADQAPMSAWGAKPNQRIGSEWAVSLVPRRASRMVLYDTSHWKSFVHARLAAAPADPTALLLPGDRPGDHDLLASQLAAEQGVPLTGRGRTVNVWRCPPHADNHWWDCLVGCAVAASIEGAALPSAAAPPARASPARRKVTYLDGSPQEG